MMESNKELGDHRPVQIVKIGKNGHGFTLDKDAVKKILCDAKVKDKPACVISVAGPYRKGKSFLLNFLLRYLARGGKREWMGEGTDDDNSPLKGFHWKGGCERDTVGMFMWSEVFETKLESGKEVAILLMDTQGTFDSNSTTKDCATIFALSAMLSSILIYNLNSDIQEDDLQHLQLFTEYGKLAMKEADCGAPFQKLQFLVRNWTYPYAAEYGAKGGQEMVDRRLQVSELQHPEPKLLRKSIAACYEKIDGFLLPYPGTKVTTDPNFDGKLLDIDPDFKNHLNDFVPSLLSRSNLLPRNIGGNEVRCNDLVLYMEAYVDLFNGEKLPEPKSIWMATIEANNLASTSEAIDKYISLMEDICGKDKPYIKESKLEDEHRHIKSCCLQLFCSKCQMGGKEIIAKYREELEEKLDDSYQDFKIINNGNKGSKNTYAEVGKGLAIGVGVVAAAGIFVAVAPASSAVFLTTVAKNLKV